MKVVAILHGKKAEQGITDKPAAIRSNPNLSVEGIVGVHALVEQVKAMGPYVALYSSRLARALDTASIFALALNMDIRTVKELGQHSSRDANGDCFYPGFEGETVIEWRDQAIKALLILNQRHSADDTVLVVSHRPSVGGLIAHTRGITDEPAIMDIVMNTSGPIVEFNVDDQGKITLIE
jgi:broad specificity phosphatase PhoE